MNERMTDRELLEAAARAAGITFSWINGGGAREDRKPGIMQPYVRWNPLEDGDDALRLAVDLNINIDCDDGCCRAFGDVFVSREDHNGDKYAATLRAIVKAAAMHDKKER